MTVKVVAHSDEPTDDYHLNRQLSSALWSLMMSSPHALAVWPTILQFCFTALIASFLATSGSCMATLHYLLSTKQ